MRFNDDHTVTNTYYWDEVVFWYSCCHTVWIILFQTPKLRLVLMSLMRFYTRTPAMACWSKSLQVVWCHYCSGLDTETKKHVRRKDLALSLFWLSTFKRRDRTITFLAWREFCWYMHPSLQSKHSILIRLVTVTHVAIEKTLMFALNTFSDCVEARAVPGTP